MLAPISNIICETRIREVSPDTVSALAASMSEVGLLNPITVSKAAVVRNGRAQDGYLLIGGLHRLEAAKRLGWTEIAVSVTELTGFLAIIAECDENLCGTNLSPAERALFTARRKEAYEMAHPETRNGATGGGHNQLRKVCEAAPRFTADTAAKTGRSERLVQMDAKRGGIDSSVLAQVRGTDLDKGLVLDRLARAPSASAELAAIRREQEAEEARRRNMKTDRTIERTEAQLFAGWLMERTDLNELPVIISWLEGCKPKDVIAALRREAA